MKLTNPSHRSLYSHYDPELIDSLSDDFIYIYLAILNTQKRQTKY